MVMAPSTRHDRGCITKEMARGRIGQGLHHLFGAAGRERATKEMARGCIGQGLHHLFGAAGRPGPGQVPAGRGRGGGREPKPVRGPHNMDCPPKR